MTGTTKHPIAVQLTSLRAELNATFLERADVIHAMMLALLSAEHVFMLGPPGTAKSELVRAVVHRITGARYFECALSKTRPAEAVLGPLDIKAFREQGDYKLKRKGFATDVEILFLDEVGKMSPILGHDLLYLTNERGYHEVNGGLSTHPAPLSTMFGASNEMITDDNDDAAALWDRLLLRVVVDYLKNSDNFKTLLVGAMASPTTAIAWDELKAVIDNVVPAVTMSEAALKGMVSLRHEFNRESIHISDRRWRASVKVLKAAAFLDGRDEIIEDDLAVLRFTLWDTPEQIPKVERLCMIAANPYVERLIAVREAITEVDNAITERSVPDASGNDQLQARRQYGKEAVQKLGKSRDQLDALLMEASGRKIPGFKTASDEHLRVLLRAFMVCMEQTEDEAQIMMAKRLGGGSGGNE